MQHRILIIACLTLCSLNCFSQEEKFESVHVENKIVFKGNIGSVWVYLSNLGNLQNLVPSTIKHSVIESKNEESIVTLTLQNGSRIIEKVTDISHKKHTICYTMIETPLPIRNYLACFKVTKVNTEDVEVIFEADFSVQNNNREQRIRAFNKKRVIL